MVQVPKSHYDFMKYESSERFASYWCQINMVIGLKPMNVLEVGVGPGMASHVLARGGPVSILDLLQTAIIV